MKLQRYLILLSFLFLLNSCHVGRFFYWNFADTGDLEKFESVPIKKGGAPFLFKEVKDDINFVFPEIDEFEKVLEKSKTTAFLVIKDDQILYEKYFNEYTKATDHPSFSVSKSFISALIGIAIQEGHITSLEDPIRKYLPELDASFDPVTLGDVINMQSGIKFSEGYFNPFGEVAKFYYGTNLKKYVKKLKVNETPGLVWKYKSGNTQLLSLALESATQRPLHEYFQEKIWQPLGMEYDASWSIDSKKHQTAKAFCCLNAKARDYAKFARLYLKEGTWNNTQIVPKEWISKTTSFTDKRSKYIYSHHWWRNITREDYVKSQKDTTKLILKEAKAPYTDYQARGILGQFMYINPEKDIVIIRLGDRFKGVNWSSLFRDIADLN
ncbi:serine hydrolase [uncultured Dokdonia sp.]|uniref:serine hydrolase domain-containing protein n=1 Tax=uncultured Dokdonia sp. TaxID=575653 RepID=UPI0026357B0A|nr:serine hydrolase [uncultured Dokdonia sp.]